MAHYIGNPPFGHSGEKAIGHYFKNGPGQIFKDQLNPKEYQDLCDFEGNANGFKVLTQDKQGAKGGIRLSYATLGAFTKYPKESLPIKPNAQIASKKYGFFQTEKNSFLDVANELGLKKLSTKNIQYSRHPLAFLVEAADDICYTIIDFEDGINLGLIQEDFALEYLINLVRDTIDTKKYSALNTTKERVSYLRALAISTLIEDAVSIFMTYENEILEGEFYVSILDKSKYQAQINDIIKLSVEKIYNSDEVIDKEISGFEILNQLLDRFILAANNNYKNTPTSYDKLLLKLIPNEIDFRNDSLYIRMLNVCYFVSLFSDTKAVLTYKKIKGLGF